MIGRLLRIISSARLRRRLTRILIALAALAALLVGAYACAGKARLHREIRETPRDPATGIVLGTEALTLDPPARPGRGDTPTTACLLIHGFIGSRKDFADLGPRLAAAGFHVEMIRLPGHGTTPTEFAGQTPESLLGAVTERYRALSIQYRAVNVIGFSMGGSLATLLAARERPARLVLASPYYRVTHKWFYLLPVETWNALLRPFIPYLIKFDYYIKVNRIEARKNIYCYRSVSTRGAATLTELGRRARAPETLRAIQSPTLLVMAEGDEAASPAHARAALAAMVNAPSQAHWLSARNNHHIFWDYDCEEAKTAIVNFLK